jgi:hypothetical protein
MPASKRARFNCFTRAGDSPRNSAWCRAEGQAIGRPFAAKAAIGGDDEPLRRDIFERLPDQPGDMLGRFDDRVAMIDDADADLFVGLEFGEERQVLAVIAGAFESDDIGVQL